MDSVIRLECDGAVEADATRLLQPEFPFEMLRAFDGQLHGEGLKFGPGKKTDDYALDWTKLDQFVSWRARLNRAATYEVSVNYTASESLANSGFEETTGPAAVPKNSGGGTFAVSFGSQVLRGEAKTGTNQIVSLGRVSLLPGNFEIKVTATKINGGELMRLRSLNLKPLARP